MTNKSHFYKTPVPLFYFPLSCRLSGREPAGTFWADSRFFSTKNLHSGARAFTLLQLSKAHTEFPCKVMVLHVIMDAHSHASRWRKVHSIVCVCVQATARSAARGSVEDLCFHQVFKLTPTNESCFRDTSASLSIVPRQHPPAFSCSSWLWLPQQSVVGAWICEIHSDRLCNAVNFWHESGPKHRPNVSEFQVTRSCVYVRSGLLL